MRDFIILFNDTATTEIYTLSLHDALPISEDGLLRRSYWVGHLLPKQGLNRLTATAQRGGFEPPTPESYRRDGFRSRRLSPLDRKSTRLKSSYANISYAVFCLKKKQTQHHS